jgi:hypothetical protein
MIRRLRLQRNANPNSLPAPTSLPPRRSGRDPGVTLLVSLYTSRGIVFAADSQITVEAQPGAGTQRLEPQTKLQRVRRLGIGRAGGVVGYFGLAEMNRQPMDDWLRERIDRFSGSRTVEDFAVYLRNELATSSRVSTSVPLRSAAVLQSRYSTSFGTQASSTTQLASTRSSWTTGQKNTSPSTTRQVSRLLRSARRFVITS